jgi:hypothetical protein
MSELRNVNGFIDADFAWIVRNLLPHIMWTEPDTELVTARVSATFGRCRVSLQSKSLTHSVPRERKPSIVIRVCKTQGASVYQLMRGVMALAAQHTQGRLWCFCEVAPIDQVMHV